MCIYNIQLQVQKINDLILEYFKKINNDIYKIENRLNNIELDLKKINKKIS